VRGFFEVIKQTPSPLSRKLAGNKGKYPIKRKYVTPGNTNSQGMFLRHVSQTLKVGQFEFGQKIAAKSWKDRRSNEAGRLETSKRNVGLEMATLGQ
jgi:hypothetical protein